MTAPDDELKQRAEAGDAEAQYEYAMWWLANPRAPKHRAYHLLWLRNAMLQDHRDATFLMAEHFRTRQARTDPDQAAKLYEKADALGHPEAKGRLGVMIHGGMGPFEPDVPRALELFEQGSAQGDGMSSYLLGLAHQNGKHVPQDGDKALAYMRKGAEQGSVQAQVELSNWLFHGHTGVEDREESRRWMREAGLQGHAQAAYQTGMDALEEGDVTTAFVFLGRAANLAHGAATREAKAVLEVLTPEQLEAARKEIREGPQRYGQDWRDWILP